ncbi:DUF3604 domain-containing protein [Candidatus Litorirhabdus singularis]|nr:DUF3604 domain-containing protein [Candidatus Litorirhabdus singularis]
MIKKLALGLLALTAVTAGGVWVLGLGPFGSHWESAPATPGPRLMPVAPNVAAANMSQADTVDPVLAAASSAEILFGDFHVHTNWSIDAAMFGLPMMTDSEVVTPADACDFARYCSALDFWSINDHAEGMTPRSWQDSVDAIRDCNAQSGDPQNPDMVSFVGWEWSQGANQAEGHYGHKNVIFREWEPGVTPLRPISSQKIHTIAKMMPAPALGAMSINSAFFRYQDFASYVRESVTVPTCPAGVSAADLPADCREVAATPDVLYRKLDELGYDAVVIPHGLAWGRTNPRDADFANQMPQHNARYQTLIETFSGHGNSEVFADFERRIANPDGSYECAEATADFIPCCQRAGELIRQRCEDPLAAECEQRTADARRFAAEVLDDRSRGVVAGASLEDWGNCGQLLNSFLPAWYYVNRQSTQYALALGDFSQPGAPQRARFGIMASSDGHKARPGTGYKQFDRTIMTDTKEVGKSGASPALGLFGLGGNDAEASSVLPLPVADKSFLSGIGRRNRMGSFYYTGGLIAVHSAARDRDSIWEGVAKKQVYGTSGERILLWFDLLNGENGEAPMGSEVSMADNPRFRVRALGAFVQKPGCPADSVQALGAERVASLCRGECYHPGDQRKPITRIEVVRIRPQQSAGEAIAPLIEDSWKTFPCPADGTGCTVEFSDDDFAAAQRETVYYVRAIAQAQPTINGDNYRCEYNGAGECVKIKFCSGEAASREEDCLAPAEPRAWSSPVFIEYKG